MAKEESTIFRYKDMAHIYSELRHIKNKINEIEAKLEKHQRFIEDSPEPKEHFEHHIFIASAKERIDHFLNSFFNNLGRFILLFIMLGFILWISSKLNINIFDFFNNSK